MMKRFNAANLIRALFPWACLILNVAVAVLFYRFDDSFRQNDSMVIPTLLIVAFAIMLGMMGIGLPNRYRDPIKCQNRVYHGFALFLFNTIAQAVITAILAIIFNLYSMILAMAVMLALIGIEAALTVWIALKFRYEF